MGKISLRIFAPLLVGVLLLGACESGGAKGKAATPLQFAGIALPQGYTIVEKDTLILGEGERWTGRLVYEVNSSPEAMFDFIRRQMPQLGWTEVSVVRAKNSALTYSSAGTGRFTTIEIVPDMILWGSTVRMVMSPIGGAQLGPQSEYRSGARNELQPAPRAMPRDSISSQPLR